MEIREGGIGQVICYTLKNGFLSGSSGALLWIAFSSVFYLELSLKTETFCCSIPFKTFKSFVFVPLEKTHIAFWYTEVQNTVNIISVFFFQEANKIQPFVLLSLKTE